MSDKLKKAKNTSEAPLSELVNKERLVNLFSELVSKDSPSFGERAVCDCLTAHLQKLGLSPHEDGCAAKTGGNCGNLYTFLPGTGETQHTPLLFCGHMDTVEPSRGKRAIVRPDGKITSAGDTVLGADDVSALTAILEALHVLQEHKLPHRPLELLFTAAEEPYCAGIRPFDFEQLKSKEAYVLDLAGPVGSAATKAPTILSFRAEFTGRAAHAGFAPEQGIHAIRAAGIAITAIPCGHISPDTTVNIGTVHGGTGDNIVPDHCVITGEIRSFSDEKASHVLAQITCIMENAAAETSASVAVTSDRHCVAYETAAESAVVRRFIKACHAEGITPTLCSTCGGSDNNHLALHGIRGIVAANAMNNCHTCKEYSNVDELVRITGIVLRLMTSTDEPTEKI